MRHALTYLVLLLGLFVNTSLFAQTVIIDEDFSDGNFTDNPTWTDHESKHTVNANNLLQLNAPSESDDAVITTESSAAYGEWEALIELDFNPSGSNLSRFYIISDTENMKGDLQGYYIQIGGRDDEISLYRQDGNRSTEIIDGTDDLINASSVNVRIRATRDLDGNWELFADPSGGISFTSQGTAKDDTYSISSYIGLLSDYTSTRSDLFAYDDITVTKITPPLAIQDINTIDNQTIDVIFNLDIDSASSSTSDFALNNSVGNPDAVSLPEANVVRLNYNLPVPSGKYTLTVDEIDDIDGNTIDINATIDFNLFGDFDDGDIIINEFMYDEPDELEEYIEIKNTSDKYLNLANWKISDNSNTSTLGSDPIPIVANGFWVVSNDTTALFNVFGDRDYHQANFPALNNTTSDAVQLITDNGKIADSLTYNSDWGGKDVALERRSAETASIYQENWGDSPNFNRGTPGVPNEITADNTPPKLLSLEVTSEKSLQLAFDERINNPGNYDISNSSIAAVEQSAADTVKLSLGSDLQNAQEYTFSISGAEDIFGNTISPFDTTLTFYEPSPVDPGDIAINEFMYAPPPASSEYVELYNHSDKSLDLQDWTLSDNRESFEGTVTSSQFIVPPDSFVVIAPDNTIEENYPNILLITMSSFPALNNGGDQIIIRDKNGTLLDSLQYNSRWGGNEIALERRSVSVSAIYSENWDGAPNSFGTPGKENEISSDEIPPSLNDFIIDDATTLTLIFSENIDPSSATSDQRYQITPNRNVQLISVNNDTVSLFLDEELISGETCEIAVSGIADIFGNTMEEAKAEAEFLKIEDPEHGDIVINEFLYNPDPDGADFVELYNRSDKNIDLSNWIIGDSSTEASIPEIQLRANSYIVLTGSSSLLRLNNNVYNIRGFPALNNNTPDAIYLRTKSGLTIDSLRYQQSWSANEEGASLERRDPERASNDASNWQNNNSEKGHSAGTKNTTFQEDDDPPEVIFSKVLPDGNIHVQFSEFIRLTEDTKFFSADQKLQVDRYDSINANIIILTPKSAQKSGVNNTTVTIHNISDVKGNVTSRSEIAISQPMKPSDLVINEIMFNPLADSDDNQPDQSEYIELRNTRDYAISLEGVVVHDAPDENGDIGTLHPVSTTAKWVPPEGQVLLYADDAAAFDDSKIASFFGLESTDPQSIMRIDRSTLSLASTDDAIYLADSTGAVIDSVFYDEEWHNPNIIDTRGIALERVAPGGPSNDESNWGSSVNEKGGTPNNENSIYQESNEHLQETGISFSPNPFSPDSDGYEDNLFINYNLDHQDYLIDVQIYDRYGRPVRELADGKQAGFNGKLIWDGRKDDGSRNRIGIYIVVFEAYDSSSGSDQAFKETVVLARKLN